jgi:predicted AAA+ superfamily ATPase
LSTSVYTFINVPEMDYEAEEKISEKTIKYVPIWKWLLGPAG